MDKKIIITINREYGSGGRIMGQKLSERLGIPYYDEDIIKMSSEYSAISEEYFRLYDEKPGNNILQKMVGGLRNPLDKPSIGENITSPDNLFRFESEVIRNEAAKESCIFIGRCSDFVLQSAGISDFISIFVYAELTAKIKRLMDVFGIDTREALNRIQNIDKKRGAYYRYYTGQNWDDMTHYDLPVNTTNIDLEQATELVVQYLRIRGYNI